MIAFSSGPTAVAEDGRNEFCGDEVRQRYLSASAVVIHYEEALYQVYTPLPLPFSGRKCTGIARISENTDAVKELVQL